MLEKKEEEPIIRDTRYVAKNLSSQNELVFVSSILLLFFLFFIFSQHVIIIFLSCDFTSRFESILLKVNF